MENWKEKEFDWAQEVGYNYRTLLCKLKRGISSQERDALVKAISRVNDYHAQAMEG